MLSKLQGKRGFTLIELIIVVVILGILILIVLAATRGDKNKASDASKKADLARVQQALEDCFVTGTGYQAATSTCVTEKFDNGVPTTVTGTPADGASSYTISVTLSDNSSSTAKSKQ